MQVSLANLFEITLVLMYKKPTSHVPEDSLAGNKDKSHALKVPFLEAPLVL